MVRRALRAGKDIAVFGWWQVEHGSRGRAARREIIELMEWSRR
jgi:hypothetical protein